MEIVLKLLGGMGRVWVAWSVDPDLFEVEILREKEL